MSTPTGNAGSIPSGAGRARDREERFARAESPVAEPPDFSRTRDDLLRHRAGDTDAFERIVTRYRPGLEALVERRIRRVENEAVRRKLSAADVTQLVLVTVSRKLLEFEDRGPGSLYGWMDRIASHQVSDLVEHWEADKRNVSLEVPMPDSVAQRDPGGALLYARGPGPATLTERDEQRRRVLEAVSTLSERDQEIVVMRWFFNVEWAEIANKVGSPSASAVQKDHDRRILPVLGRALGPH